MAGHEKTMIFSSEAISPTIIFCDAKLKSAGVEFFKINFLR